MRIGRFLKVAGVLLLAWGIASWFLPFDEGQSFYTDTGYNALFLCIGLLVTWIGTTWNPELRRIWTVYVAALFLVLAVAGLIVAGRDAPNLWVMNLENPTDNVIHLAVGLIFLAASIFGKPDVVYGEPPGTTMNVR
jgi:peptidoglycan/LPS O-acetylase OafA/YrhL